MSFRQQATSQEAGVQTVDLYTLLPTPQGISPGECAFAFRNVGTASGYVVIGAETETALEIPADGKTYTSAVYDWTAANTPDLELPAGADVWITPFVRGPR